jgi:hypothetical protein
MHDNVNKTSDAKVEQINQQIEAIYTNLRDRILTCTNYAITLPLHKLKSKGMTYKMEWITSANTTLAALSGRLGQSDDSAS